MTPWPSRYKAIGLLAVVAVLSAILVPSPAAYLTVVLTAAFALIYRVTRAWPDRAFYLVCTGVLLVAISASVSVWEGLAAGWLVAAVFVSATGIVITIRDLPVLLAGGFVTVAIALMIALANHVLLPLIVLCTAAVLFLGIMAVRDHRFRKEYSGASP